MEKKKDVIAVALGTRGGRKTFEKHGSNHYSNMAKKSAEVRRNKKKDLSTV